MDNALKYTFRGYIKILIENDFLEENVIKLNVKDSGIGLNGISLERLRNLFNFGGIEDKLNKHATGANLGLTITQALVKNIAKENMKFCISVDSIEDMGSDFYFFIHNKVETLTHE